MYRQPPNVQLKEKAPGVEYKYETLDRAAKDFLPAILPLKATAFSGPCPGIAADVFDESGHANDTKYIYNWDYYLGSYVFATKKTQELIDKLLLSSDPGNHPIIIIQSDHGARNMAAEDPDSVILPDYPDDYKYYILNALLLPGSDYSQLKDDLAPINTFPLVLNMYFGEHLPLE